MNLHSITCPSCKRRAITRRDFIYAGLDGTTVCGSCGRLARLDMFSRWVVSCLIALVLPSVLLYGDLFYSGHLFVVSILLVFAAWRALTIIGFPLLTLEEVPDPRRLQPRQSVVLAVVLLVGAMTIDIFMASRFEKGPDVANAAADNLKR
jgi:hypothetical protein